MTRRFDHRFLPYVNCKWYRDSFHTSVIDGSHSHKSCDAHVTLESIICHMSSKVANVPSSKELPAAEIDEELEGGTFPKLARCVM